MSTAETAPAKPKTVPEEKPEPPFSVDALSQSTARFERRSWLRFLAIREDLEAVTA